MADERNHPPRVLPIRHCPNTAPVRTASCWGHDPLSPRGAFASVSIRTREPLATPLGAARRNGIMLMAPEGAPENPTRAHDGVPGTSFRHEGPDSNSQPPARLNHLPKRPSAKVIRAAAVCRSDPTRISSPTCRLALSSVLRSTTQLQIRQRRNRRLGTCNH